MCRVSFPEMEKRNYKPELSAGSIATGGTLGILIPPSGVLIVYGILTEESIGKLFVAGIVPGIMLAFLFMSYIWIRVKVNPKLAPHFEAMPWKHRLSKILGMWPIFVIMLPLCIWVSW